jgi:hypothetical protein
MRPRYGVAVVEKWVRAGGLFLPLAVAPDVVGVNKRKARHPRLRGLVLSLWGRGSRRRWGNPAGVPRPFGRKGLKEL